MNNEVVDNEVETIDDIIKEMREFADRIEAAYKREMEAGMMCDMSCRESGHLLEQYAESEKRLFKENKELRKQLEKDEELLASLMKD